MPLCDVTQYEKGRLAAPLSEKIQHAAGVELHARLGRIPMVARDGSFESCDLEVLLDVDRQRISQRERWDGRRPWPGFRVHNGVHGDDTRLARQGVHRPRRATHQPS
jgi:hypothetical protein